MADLSRLRQAANDAYQWSRVKAASIFKSLRPQTCWDAIPLFINILSILRLFISLYPESDVVVIPYILRDILHVKLNDIVVISLWLLLPILCSQSFLSQLRAKPNNMEFRTLFFESLFGNRSHIFKSYVPIPTLLLTPLSLWYIWTIVSYIYAHWTVEFAPALHALQLYPAVFMLFQSVFQGCYLLWMHTLPTFSDNHKNKESFQSDLREYIYENMMFVIHCICLTLIAHKDEPGLYHLAVGEIAYRLLAVVSLTSLAYQTTDQNTQHPAPSSNTTQFDSTSTVDGIATEESHSGPSLLVCSPSPVPSSNHHAQASILSHHSPSEQRGAHKTPQLATPHREGDRTELVTPFQPHLQYSELLNLEAETTLTPVQCTDNNTTLPTPREMC